MRIIQKKTLLLTAAMLSLLGAAGSASAAENTDTLKIDVSSWHYDADNDVYWQIGVTYCASPAATAYESMGIYVPGAYMNASDNGDGTYTCTINTEQSVGNYTAETAPVVIPVNTPGYSAQAAPTAYNYSEIAEYMTHGFVYVDAGCRGRNNGTNEDGSTYDGGAPWGVTDLKAAIRYIRYNSESLPGDDERIFTFGMSGGGAQSAVTGATGDSELYFSYLESIGAAMEDEDGNYISDAICGAMCWCPITSLDQADESYEWMMGQYNETGTRADDTWTSALSDDLADAFASYINELGLTDEAGTVLTLTETESGIYTAGSYYDYLLNTIEESLNNFLSDTEFPYTSDGNQADENGFGRGGFGGRGARMEFPDGELPGEMNGAPNGEFPGEMNDTPNGELPDEMNGTPNGELPDEMNGAPDDELPGGMNGAPNRDMQFGGRGNGRNEDISSAESQIYETPQDYIDSLNSDEEWVIYDEETNTVSITSVGAFVRHCKSASKNVGAFDDLNTSQAENAVFGNSEDDSLHFDSVMASLLAKNSDTYAAFNDYDEAYAAEYADDMNNADALGIDTETRQNMYNPLYYLCDYYEGAGSSVPAKYWRIRTGITQGDTSLTTEMNLALALEASDAVESIDFATVWNQGHTMAERTGSSTENFIAWVEECCN